MQTEWTLRELVKSLRSETCPACEKPKRRKQTFCRACYFSLPKGLQKRLYRGLGNGYEQAFADSMELLQQEGEANDG